MPSKSYRLYCLGERGRINFADWIKADTDEEAISKAMLVEHGGHAAEIWDRDRFVATLKGKQVSWSPSRDDPSTTLSPA